MMKTAVERLAEAIGSPESVSGGAVSFAFTVDGTEIAARESGGRIVLERLRSLFEVFTTSCDWWAERVKEALPPEPVFPEMVIMP